MASSTQPGISQWTFSVVPPSNASGFMLTGGSVFNAMNTQHLTLDPTAVGQYRVFLAVKDDVGQQSGTIAQLTINVFQ